MRPTRSVESSAAFSLVLEGLESVPTRERRGLTGRNALSMLPGPDTATRAGVAQLVEHLICNEAVGGSSPFASSPLSSPGGAGFSASPLGGVPERPKGADCKSAGDAFEGSNPSPSTNLVVGHRLERE